MFHPGKCRRTVEEEIALLVSATIVKKCRKKCNVYKNNDKKKRDEPRSVMLAPQREWLATPLICSIQIKHWVFTLKLFLRDINGKFRRWIIWI